jgi:Tfp pilus assembly PilM family ATPase
MEAGKEAPKPYTLPKALQARHVSLAISSKAASVKLLNFLGKVDDTSGAQISEMMGLEKPDEYRISYKVITEGRGRTESKVLTVAVPDTEARAACQLFPAGLPAPYSVEVAGLAAMTAFIHGPGREHTGDAVGVIDFGAELSFLALFNKGALALARKFDIGATAILARVQKTLGVDAATAKGIVSDGSFDVSQTLNEVMDPFLKQLTISRDFVERRENCHVARLYTAGGMTPSRDWQAAVRAAIGLPLQTWNPFENANLQVGANALPADVKGQEARFAAAVGAALATFEDT